MILQCLLTVACGFLKKARLGDLHLAGDIGNEPESIAKERKRMVSKILAQSSDPCSHREVYLVSPMVLEFAMLTSTPVER